MLSVRRAEDICVIKVSTQVLNSPGVVITDQNAASDYVRFVAPTQWEVLNFDDIFSRDWTHPEDKIRHWRHKSRKCAEVLVPRLVPPHLIQGAVVADASASAKLKATGFSLPITIDSDFFFRNS